MFMLINKLIGIKCNTILDSVMRCNISEFREYKKKEKVLYYLKSSYEKIKRESKYNNVIKLEPINNISEEEISAYKQMLSKYLIANGYNGELVDVGYEYNKMYNEAFPVNFNCNPFYVFEYHTK